jgi:hypothetical protein
MEGVVVLMTRRRTSCSLSDLGIHSSYALRIQSAVPQILPLPHMRFSKIGRNFIGSLFQNQKAEARKQIRTYVTSKAAVSTSVQPSTHQLLVRSLNNFEDLLNDKDYKNSEEVQLVTNGKGGFWCRFETKKTYGFSRKIPNAPFQFLKAGNPHGWPVHAAFGVKDSFVFVYSDGHVDWDLKSSYSDLDKVFLKRLTKPKELLFVALNPFAADQFFCAFSDHSVTYSFPSGEAWKEIDEFILSGTGLRVISDSPTLRSSADPSTSSTSGAGTNSLVKFAEKEAKEAAKDMTENAISDWLGN